MTEDDWRAARGRQYVPYADIDDRDGYLHLSTYDQALETARRYFSGHTDLLALEIPLVAIADAVTFEPVPERNNEAFPHLFGRLPTDAVRRVIPLRASDDGAFKFNEAAAR
ncbi:MAG: DUF952 domain-containing protein [Pseudomonadota bacterium]